jgi:hypothetical protein
MLKIKDIVLIAIALVLLAFGYRYRKTIKNKAVVIKNTVGTWLKNEEKK